nr:MAG TPA: hypothetical protein [Caudoviricetes sp.]
MNKSVFIFLRNPKGGVVLNTPPFKLRAGVSVAATPFCFAPMG